VAPRRYRHAIVSMHCVDPCVRVVVQALTRAIPHLFISRTDIDDAAVIDIDEPNNLGHIFGDLMKSLFAFAQRRQGRGPIVAKFPIRKRSFNRGTEVVKLVLLDAICSAVSEGVGEFVPYVAGTPTSFDWFASWLNESFMRNASGKPFGFHTRQIR
jgi:hypothetical protein